MGSYSFTGGAQVITIATTGDYNIQAYGGAGGSDTTVAAGAQTGGNGAGVGGIFHLTAGEKIKIVVGGQGKASSNQDGAGGGGGTFILGNTGGGYVPLIVAAGGGGGGYTNSASVSGLGFGGLTTGSNTGLGGAGAGANGGGGGTGFITPGTAGGTNGGGGGSKYTGGTTGGAANTGTGGFGGGGGGGFNGGGGGGGYSGGQGGQGNAGSPTGGVGGISFDSGIVVNGQSSASNTGNGSASLTLANPTIAITSMPPTSAPDHSPFTITGTADFGTSIPLANGTVTLTDNGTTVGTGTTAADGTFSIGVTLPFSGANSVVATVVDSNGVSGSSSPSTFNLFKAVRDLDSTSQEVERIFYSLLNRAADATSLSFWDNKITKQGTRAEKSLASSLINSKEFKIDNGHHQTASQFVSALFEAALGRPVDSGSLATDVHALQHGLSKQSLAVSIANSPEAVGHLGVKPV